MTADAAKAQEESMNFLSKLFGIFIIASVCGYLIEFVWTLLTQGMLINHSAVVIGPFNFAYGICAVALTLFLQGFAEASPLKIFLISFMAGTILEYVMSWGMELVLGFTAWDYSHLFLNLNGRVCLLFSVFWGLLGVVWIKYLYPFIDSVLSRFDPHVFNNVMLGLVVFLLIDVLITVSAVARARAADQGVPPANAYERLLDATFDSDYLKNMFNNNWK